MKASEDLFHLIKSLSKNEKRHFKLLSGLEKGDKLYITVFDLIDSQKIYDEQKILSRLNSQAHLQQFPVIKNYLYYSILRCLNFYSKESGSGKEIHDLLNYAEQLFKKGLYAQCKKILAKAKAIAERLNKQALLLDVLNWETKLLLIENKEHLLEEHIAQMASALKEMQNVNTYRTHAFRIHTLFNQIGKPRNKKDIQKYESVYRSALKNESQASSFQSKWLFYNLMTSYTRVSDDIASRYMYSKKAVEHIEEKPDLICEDPEMYIASMQNYIVVLLDMRKQAECLEAIHRFREYIENKKLARNRSALGRIFSISYIAELDLLFKTSAFEQGLLYVKEVGSGIEKFKSGLSKYNEIILYCCVSRLYFGAGQFKKSILWLNKAMQNPEGIRQDLFSFMKIFNLIIHFELGNSDILPYIIKSTYRYFYKSERLFKFEKAVLAFLRKLKPGDSRKQLTAYWKEVKNIFTSLEKDPLEKNAFDYFDYTSWLESKIENRPFSESIIKKYGNQ